MQLPCNERIWPPLRKGSALRLRWCPGACALPGTPNDAPEHKLMNGTQSIQTSVDATEGNGGGIDELVSAPHEGLRAGAVAEGEATGWRCRRRIGRPSRTPQLTPAPLAITSPRSTERPGEKCWPASMRIPRRNIEMPAISPLRRSLNPTTDRSDSPR